MKNYYNALINLLTRKVNNRYVLNSEDYLQLRFFIDSISQNERFGKIADDQFEIAELNEGFSDDSRSINLSRVYKILKSINLNYIRDFIRDLKTKKAEIYSTFNTLRNQDYKKYIQLISNSKDFSIDDGRIEFQYIYVTPTVGNYIMLVDNNIYLENIDSLRVKKGLREMTNLGNIKKRQDKNLAKLNADLEFESCYV